MAGYSKDRFVDLSEREADVLTCGICLEIMKDPKDINCCKRRSYCSECINQWISKNNSCPTCRKNMALESLSDPTLLVINLINSLTIKCDFSDKGCTDLVKVEHLSKHVISCDHNPKKVCTDCGIVGNYGHNCVSELKSKLELLEEELRKSNLHKNEFNTGMIKSIEKNALESAKQGLTSGDVRIHAPGIKAHEKDQIYTIVYNALLECSNLNRICKRISDDLDDFDDSVSWCVIAKLYDIGKNWFDFGKYFVRIIIGDMRFFIFSKDVLDDSDSESD